VNYFTFYCCFCIEYFTDSGKQQSTEVFMNRIVLPMSVLFLMVAYATCGHSAEQKIVSPDQAIRSFVPGTKITLKPRKDRYFLGENILLDYQISYEGEGRIAVQTPTGLGKNTWCTVIATDQNGNPMPESTLEFECTGSSGRYFGRGEHVTYTIPLNRYCRFERQGVYRIRAAHNLGWTKADGSTGRPPIIPQDDPRWAETTILLIMPDAEQARGVVEQMSQLRLEVNQYRHLGGLWEMEDYTDFMCLQYQVYLPILEEMIANMKESKRALIGIAHIPTHEATEALFRLMEHPDRDIALMAAGALNDRLPDPQAAIESKRKNPIVVEDADPQLVKPAWRSNDAVTARRLAGQMLSDKELIRLQCAAFIFESVGTAADMSALISALDKTIPLIDNTDKEKETGLTFTPRDACMDLVHAIEAIVGRGAVPPLDPHTPGEFIQYVVTIGQRSGFRPVGWEKQCASWARREGSFVREILFIKIPRPLPGMVLEQIALLLQDKDYHVVLPALQVIKDAKDEKYQDDVRRLIASTMDLGVIKSAVQVAIDLNIPADEVLEMLAERLDSRNIYTDVLRCLYKVLETGKCEDIGCVPLSSEKADLASAKIAWKNFLKEYGAEIRKGRRFTSGDPEIKPEMNPR
jgi:hypothetical protein